MRNLWFVACLLSFVGTAHAELITVDPRTRLPGTDISNATPGVTLSTWIHSPSVGFSFTPIFAMNCGDCSALLAGQRVFSGGPFGTKLGGTSYASAAFVGPIPAYAYFHVLRADFAAPTNYVEIITGAGEDGPGDLPDLVALDNVGNVIRCDYNHPACTRVLLSPQVPNQIAGLWKFTIQLNSSSIVAIVAGGTSASNRVASLTFAAP
jgi:hypothetical protein